MDDNKYRNDISKKIKIARKRSGKTQIFMAENLKISRQTYLDAESGKTEVRVTMLRKIAELTNLPLSWFIEEMPSSQEFEKITESMHVIEFLTVISRLPEEVRAELLRTSSAMASLMLNHTSSSKPELETCSAE
ncbi:helix-turn-helix domain-containing protein [Veronia pacifica]|uniref:HTH cro/C1-type domain-containing protein n=1 Tax=Veronia pacifica TaxID=1080227 RepID=A0A1C3ESG3_9GAMM|nr:helix-turn-helix domain-containing protein [Veronia pacifica]ODA36113.1 hypothetical protein A8L45_00470 [Veronia pacifica]